MRNRILAVAAVALATACASVPRVAEYDAEAEAALGSQVDQMFQKMDAGDFAWMREQARGADELVVFDFDPENRPLNVRGQEEFGRMLDTYQQMTSQGGRIQTTVVRKACHATSNHGYCTVEFDQSFTMGGQAMGPFKFRGTFVARRAEDRWVWTHWHGSFREMPQMPAQGAAPAAPAEGGAAPAATP